MTERSHQYWALCANPDVYRIEDAVAEVEFDDWVTKGSDIRAGDRAIIWKAKGSTNSRGIVALAEMVADPQVAPDLHPEYRQQPNPSYLANPREKMVAIRYVHPSGLPLWLDGPYHDLLSSLTIVRGNAQRSVFRIEPDQWNMILAACGGWPDEQEEVKPLSASKSQGMQGHTVDAAIRRAIELHAMGIATEYYRKRGWTVHDVSSGHPYDLHCLKTNSELHIEVKGTTSDGAGVFLTRNEVEHARLEQRRAVLFVVSRIALQIGDDGAPGASGGLVNVFAPWDVDTGELEPLTYSYKLPKTIHQPDAETTE